MASSGTENDQQGRKYSAMVERLAALQEERSKQAEARRAASQAVSSSTETPQYFQRQFDGLKNEIESGLAGLGVREPEEVNAAETRAKIDTLLGQVSGLEKMVAEASYFLPAYDIQTSQATISKLRDRIGGAEAAAIPKKKFSFKKKKQKDLEPKKSLEVKCNDIVQVQRSGSVQEPCSDALEESRFVHNVYTINNKKDMVVVQNAESLDIREIVLADLTNCTVYLKGKFQALSIHRLKQCKVYAGPVTGSILLEEVDGCVLMLASHQIRIHSTRNTDFYLRVRSRPIVEFTTGVRFAPYKFYYHGIEHDLSEANLSEETGLVDDFRWLRAAHSPNWGVVPSEQQLGMIDGSSITSD